MSLTRIDLAKLLPSLHIDKETYGKMGGRMVFLARCCPFAYLVNFFTLAKLSRREDFNECEILKDREMLSVTSKISILTSLTAAVALHTLGIFPAFVSFTAALGFIAYTVSKNADPSLEAELFLAETREADHRRASYDNACLRQRIEEQAKNFSFNH